MSTSAKRMGREMVRVFFDYMDVITDEIILTRVELEDLLTGVYEGVIEPELVDPSKMN